MYMDSVPNLDFVCCFYRPGQVIGMSHPCCGCVVSTTLDDKSQDPYTRSFQEVNIKISVRPSSFLFFKSRPNFSRLILDYFRPKLLAAAT